MTNIESKPISWLGWLWRAALAALFVIDVMGNIESIVAATSRGSLGATQSLGVVFGPSAVREPRWVGIAQVTPGASAAAAGIRPGDSMRFDEFLGQWITWRPGEQVSVTVARDGKRFPATVAVAAPADYGRAVDVIDLALAIQMLGAAGFCALLLARGWRNRAALQLATVLLLMFGRAPTLWLPHPAAALVVLVMAPATGVINYLWPMFCLEISGGPSSRRQRRMVEGTAAALGAATVYSELADSVPLPLPGAGPAMMLILVVLANVAGFAILAANYRRNDAPSRNRIRIVVLAFGCVLLAWLMNAATTVLVRAGHSLTEFFWLGIGWVALLFAALGLLTYAVLRQRLLDLGFALNRTLVYGAVSFILLAGFGLGEWAVDHLIPENWRKASELYSAGIALVLFLSFHRLRDAVERQVERLFFHHWQQNEAALRRFVASAGHFDKTPALCRAFAEEATRFAEGAQAALYLRGADGAYRLQAGRLAGAAADYADDDHASARIGAKAWSSSA